MHHNAVHHLAGAVLLSLAAGFLVGLPLVSADVRTDVALPLEQRLDIDPQAEALLLFAGFPGCQGACPAALHQLANIQDETNRTLGSGRLNVIFVNLHLDTGDPAAQRYARAFHPQFLGVTATSDERGELHRLLAQSGNTNVTALSRHPANVYLYRRAPAGWSLTRVFATAPSAQNVVAAIRTR